MQILGIDPLADVYNIVKSLKAPGEIIGLGNQWFAAAAVISVAWFGIKAALQGGQVHNLIGNFMRQIFFLGLAWWFMPSQGDLTGMIIAHVSKIASIFSGTDNLAQLVNNGIAKILAHVGTLGIALSQLITGGEPVDGITSVLAAIGRVTAYLVPITYLALALIMMMICVVAYFLMFVLSLGLTTIATMLAPIFVPFLVLPVTNFLFDGWLRFLIVACFYQVVGAIILNIVDQILGATIGKFGAAAANTSGFSAENWGDLSILSILIAGLVMGLTYLMFQTGSIAQGLVSGSASFSLSNIGNQANRVLGGAQKSVSSSAISVGKGVHGGASNLARTAADIAERFRK